MHDVPAMSEMEEAPVGRAIDEGFYREGDVIPEPIGFIMGGNLVNTPRRKSSPRDVARGRWLTALIVERGARYVHANLDELEAQWNAEHPE
jgi:hypothetical protein